MKKIFAAVLVLMVVVLFATGCVSTKNAECVRDARVTGVAPEQGKFINLLTMDEDRGADYRIVWEYLSRTDCHPEVYVTITTYWPFYAGAKYEGPGVYYVSFCCDEYGRKVVQLVPRVKKI